MAKRRDSGKEMMKMLTEDLLSEILVRLPVVSILRCRCVCKAWFNLIKTPSFINMHVKHNTSKKETILLAHYPDNLTPPVLTFHDYESLDLLTDLEMEIPRFDYQCLRISEPCNGLLCLLDYQSKLVLYNPSVGEYNFLPECPYPNEDKRGWKHHVMAFGFGFVSNEDDYKVVAFVSFIEVPLYEDHPRMEIKIAEEEGYIEDNDGDTDEDSEYSIEEDESEDDDCDCGGCVCNNYENDNKVKINKVQVYSRSTDSWRVIECEFPGPIGSNRYGTQFNGASHWIVQKKGIDSIVNFHMSTELLHEIELPKYVLDKPELEFNLTVVNGSLALFAYTSCEDYNSEEQFIDVWFMKEYGVSESWAKHVSVGPVLGILRPLMLWKDKAILLESTERQLLSCALDTQEIEEFELPGMRGLISIMVFQESMVSVL